MVITVYLNNYMNFLSILLLSTLGWSNPDSTLITSFPTVDVLDSTFLNSESILFISDSSLAFVDSASFEVDAEIFIADVQLECQIENNLIDSLVFTGTKLLGTPYRYNGNSAKGIDCSGLVHYMFNSLGANVARSSRELAKLGHEIDINQIAKGDLVFFKGRNVNSKVVGHVAYVVDGEGEEMVFLHATSKGVILDKIVKNGYYDKRFLFAKRLEYDELFEFDNFN